MQKKAELAAAHGLKRTTLVMRLKRGWPLQRALTAPPLQAWPKPGSLSSLARKHGLNPMTVRVRLKLGWTLEEALSKPPEPPWHKEFILPSKYIRKSRSKRSQ